MNLDLRKVKHFSKISGFDFTIPEYTLFIKESKTYVTKKSRLTTKDLSYHFISNDTSICLSRYIHSKIYMIDIDQRNNPDIQAENIVKSLIEELGEPFYVEYSDTSGGYHLYFKFEDYLSEEFWKWFVDYIKVKYQFNIEPIYGKKHLKLPFSCSYRKAGIVVNKNEIDFNLKGFDDIYDRFNYIFTNNHKVLPIPPIYLDSYLYETNKTLKAKRTLNFETSHIDFSYGCGNRHKKQIALGFYIKRRNGTFEDFLQACYRWNDGTSKDMSLPRDRMLNIVKGVWNYCESRFVGNIITSPENNLVFSEKKPEDMVISEKEYKKFNESNTLKLSKLIKYFYKLYNPKSKEDGVVEKRIVNECIFLIELLSNIKTYREKHQYKYKEEEYNYLNKGIPFGLFLQKMVSNKYNIKNIEEKIDFLEWCGFLSVIKTKNGYEYSYKKMRYVKHFILINLRRLYKKIFEEHHSYDISNNNLILNLTEQLKTLLFNSCNEIYNAMNKGVIREYG